jgi:multidrug resistance efflux pump
MSSTVSLPAASTGITVFRAAAARLPIRPFKVVFAGTMLTAGICGVFYESKFVSSSDAVVTAYVLNVRTPIDGTVTGLPIAAGTFVQRDQLVAEVDNPLNDHQHLDNLRTAQSAAQANAEALAVEHQALASQREGLLNRAGAYISAVTERLDQQTAEADRTLAALKLSEQEATIELDRGRALHSAGILSNADYEKLVSVQHVLAEEVSAQAAALASARTQATAAAHGILSEPGTNNDVAYSNQRADELTIRLAENTRLLIASRAQAEEAREQAATEENRSHELTQTSLRAPIGGLLWRLDAVNGERVAAGDPVLSLIDCSRQFLLVEVAQERLPDIEIGGTAHIRLTGESVERTGSVISASGDPQRAADRKLAAFPLQDPAKELATVLISLAPVGGAGDSVPCAVGRTARVRIPPLPSNLAWRWTRSVF